MIHQPDFTKQSTDRLEMVATPKREFNESLFFPGKWICSACCKTHAVPDCDCMVRIDIILLNECDATLDLKGTPKDSFLDLRNEVRERLDNSPYDVRFIDLNF